MNSLKNTLWFIGGFAAIFILGIQSARAQGTADGLAYYNRIFSNPADAQAVWRQAASPYVRPTTLAQAGLQTATITPTANGPVLSTSRALVPYRSVPNAVVPVAEAVTLTRPALAAGVRVLARANPYVLLGLAAYSLYVDDKISYDQPTQTWVKEHPGDLVGSGTYKVPHPNAPYPISQELQTGNTTEASWRSLVLSGASAHTLAMTGYNQTAFNDTQVSAFESYKNGAQDCVVARSQHANNPIGNFCGTLTPGPRLPATDSEMDEAWRNGNGPSVAPDPASQASVVQALRDNNTKIPDLGIAPVETTVPTLPSRDVATSTNTITNPDGSTTTTTTTTSQTPVVTLSNTHTLERETIIIRTIERTTVRDENNNIIRDETKTPVVPPPDEVPQNPEDESEQDLSFNDSAFPAIPNLYTQKYPDGIKGVWQAKRGELMQTGFVTGVSSMFPSIADGGQCPSTSFSMDMGIGDYTNYGMQELKVPCWLWPVLGAVFMISACFAARAILFS